MIELPTNIIVASIIIALFIFGVFILFLSNKNKQISQYEFALAKLKRSFNELDEQAKLIRPLFSNRHGATAAQVIVPRVFVQSRHVNRKSALRSCATSKFPFSFCW